MYVDCRIPKFNFHQVDRSSHTSIIFVFEIRKIAWLWWNFLIRAHLQHCSSLVYVRNCFGIQLEFDGKPPEFQKEQPDYFPYPGAQARREYQASHVCVFLISSSRHASSFVVVVVVAMLLSFGFSLSLSSTLAWLQQTESRVCDMDASCKAIFVCRAAEFVMFTGGLYTHSESELLNN